MTKTNYDVIVSPVITEKATKLSEANQVVFRVTLDSTKPQIAKAVEELFKVKVKAVNTVRTKGKMKAFRGKRFQKSEVKKAVVTLVEGYQIDVTTGL
jgi:large subunit ribosomal protein L23